MVIHPSSSFHFAIVPPCHGPQNYSRLGHRLKTQWPWYWFACWLGLLWRPLWIMTASNPRLSWTFCCRWKHRKSLQEEEKEIWRIVGVWLRTSVIQQQTFFAATIAKYTHMGKIAIDQFQRWWPNIRESMGIAISIKLAFGWRLYLETRILSSMQKWASLV